MARDITITKRELSPFEQLVLGLLCEGKTNSAIAREAYAFGTMGVIAGYGAIAALVGGIVMLLLSLAGLVHIRPTPESATI